MLNVYISVSDNQNQLTVDGSLELFGRLLQTISPPAGQDQRKPLPELAREGKRREQSQSAGVST